MYPRLLEHPVLQHKYFCVYLNDEINSKLFGLCLIFLIRSVEPEKTKILALRQPDPEKQKNRYITDSVYLEEVYWLKPQLQKYYPVSDTIKVHLINLYLLLVQGKPMFNNLSFLQPLKEYRYGGVIAYHFHKVYVVGGMIKGTATSWISSIRITDDDPVWTRLQSMPHSRRLHDCAVMHGEHFEQSVCDVINASQKLSIKSHIDQLVLS